MAAMSFTVYVLLWGVPFSLGVLVLIRLSSLCANMILKWPLEALCHKGVLANTLLIRHLKSRCKAAYFRGICANRPASRQHNLRRNNTGRYEQFTKWYAVLLSGRPEVRLLSGTPKNRCKPFFAGLQRLFLVKASFPAGRGRLSASRKKRRPRGACAFCLRCFLVQLCHGQAVPQLRLFGQVCLGLLLCFLCELLPRLFAELDVTSAAAYRRRPAGDQPWFMLIRRNPAYCQNLRSWEEHWSKTWYPAHGIVSIRSNPESALHYMDSRFFEGPYGSRYNAHFPLL